MLEFNHIIESAAKTSPQLSKTKSKKNKDSQVWFDNECKSVRKLHKKLSNRLHKAPLDIYLRQRYNDINKTYKSLLRRKKQKFYNDQIDTLVNEKDSKQFWSNLKSLKNNNGNQNIHHISSKRTFYTLQQSTFIGWRGQTLSRSNNNCEKYSSWRYIRFVKHILRFRDNSRRNTTSDETSQK